MASGIVDLTRLVGKMREPKVMQKALLSLFADYHSRIFEEGKASDGGTIGKYSTDPIYVNPADSPRSFGANIGKTGKSKFADGKPHQTRYFPGGYEQFRDKIGRPTNVVNLQLTEDLKRNTLPELNEGRYVFGFGHDFANDKATGNEAHFKKQIFDLTIKEMDSIDKKIIQAMEELGL